MELCRIPIDTLKASAKQTLIEKLIKAQPSAVLLSFALQITKVRITALYFNSWKSKQV